MQVELFVYNARPDEINKLSYAAPHSTIEYNPRGLFDPINPIFDRVAISGTANKVNMCRYTWQGLTYVCSCSVLYVESYNLYRIVGHVDPAATMYNIDGFRYCHFWIDRAPESLSIPYEPLPSAQISPYLTARKDIIGTVPIESDDDIYYILRIGGVAASQPNSISLDQIYIVNRFAIADLKYAFTQMSQDDIRLYSDSIKSVTKLTGFNLADYSVYLTSTGGAIDLNAVINTAASAQVQFKIKTVTVSSPGGVVYRLTPGYATFLKHDYALNSDIYYTKYEYDNPIEFNFGNIITCATTLRQLGISTLNQGQPYNVWRVGFRVWYDLYGATVYCAPIIRDPSGAVTVWVDGMTSAQLPNTHSWFSVASATGVNYGDTTASILGIASTTIGTAASAATGNIAGAAIGAIGTASAIAKYSAQQSYGGAIGQSPAGSTGQYKSIVSNAIYIITYRRAVTENTSAAERVTGYVANYYTEGISGTPDGVYRCSRFVFSGTADTNGYPAEFVAELTAQMQNLWYKSTPTNNISE